MGLGEQIKARGLVGLGREVVERENERRERQLAGWREKLEHQRQEREGRKQSRRVRRFTEALDRQERQRRLSEIQRQQWEQIEDELSAR